MNFFRPLLSHLKINSKEVVYNKPIIILLANLWKHIKKRRRVQLAMLLILMMIASFAEMISIGAVIPFLGVLTAPEKVFEHPYAELPIEILDIKEPTELLLPITVVFGMTAIIAGLMRLLLVWGNTRLSFATGADISINIYRRTLYQPYYIHCARNSSEVINGISVKANDIIYSIINPTLNLLSSTFMLTTILLAFLILEPIIAITTFGGFGLIYVLIIVFTRKQLMIDSQHISRESTNVIRSLQEGLGGIRDVLIDGTQQTYCNNYRNSDLKLRRAQGNNFIISSCPRFMMEALGMLFIAILAFLLSQQSDGITRAIPFLGALALTAQRLLPVLQQAYSSWSNIRGGQASLEDVVDLLEQPLPEENYKHDYKKLSFNKEISLTNIRFKYNKNSTFVLNNLNMQILKGSRVGFVGATGSGKSTLFDILMGLLKPTDGKLEVDGKTLSSKNNRNWQALISHVPQVIFLSDCTIEENIAFGIPKDQIDKKRVIQAAEQAQIAQTIETWPKKYNTLVGERGIRLSGGQRQRIGIARALYKQSEIIFFDEATSSLDNKTEDDVMRSIENLSGELTLLIIAHRVSTLKNCDQIVELSDGIIKNIGTYESLISKS